MFPSWLHRPTGPRPRTSRRPRPASRRVDWRSALRLEGLEDRTLLSSAPPAAFALGAPPAAVAVGHLLGSHAPPDVVTANANGTLSVLLGKADGSVQNPILISV